MLTRRKFALGVAFASVAGVAAARQPTKNVDYLGKNKLDKVLPEKLGKWTFVSTSGLVVPPEDQLARALYSQLLTRVYADETGEPIMLLVAQSATQTGILQIHRPEFCYTAGGYDLSPSAPHNVALQGATLPALSISATRDAQDRADRLLDTHRQSHADELAAAAHGGRDGQFARLHSRRGHGPRFDLRQRTRKPRSRRSTNSSAR